MKSSRRTWMIGSIAVVAIVAGIIGLALYFGTGGIAERRAQQVAPPEGPPDLEKYRDQFVGGLEALQRDDGSTAVRLFGSFDFGGRAVEVYRLYFLAQGHQLSGNRT